MNRCVVLSQPRLTLPDGKPGKVRESIKRLKRQGIVSEKAVCQEILCLVTCSYHLSRHLNERSALPAEHLCPHIRT